MTAPTRRSSPRCLQLRFSSKNDRFNARKSETRRTSTIPMPGDPTLRSDRISRPRIRIVISAANPLNPGCHRGGGRNDKGERSEREDAAESHACKPVEVRACERGDKPFGNGGRGGAITPWENICSTAPETPSTLAVANPSRTKPCDYTRVANDEFSGRAAARRRPPRRRSR